MRPTIVLLTDFGHLDPYVGQLKGVLAGLVSEAVVIDLCHEIAPQAVRQAEFVLQTSRTHFPRQSIFICVVDPGVGTSRRALLANNNNQFFLAPDNGLLSFLPDESTTWWQLSAPSVTSSQTFHGRDLFAPVAARLALGIAPDTLGHHINAASVFRLSLDFAQIDSTQILCQVIHVDRFGNCLLNLPIQELSSSFWIMSTGHVVRQVQTYAQLQPKEIGILPGSQQVMELAMNQEHCARFTNLVPGQILTLNPALDIHS